MSTCDGQKDRQTDRWMDILSWHRLHLQSYTYALMENIAGWECMSRGRSPEGHPHNSKYVGYNNNFNYRPVFKYQHWHCLSTAVSFRASKSTKTRRFDVKNLELDPARPHISILHHHSQLLMFVCNLYSYRELVWSKDWSW